MWGDSAPVPQAVGGSSLPPRRGGVSGTTWNVLSVTHTPSQKRGSPSLRGARRLRLTSRGAFSGLGPSRVPCSQGRSCPRRGHWRRSTSWESPPACSTSSPPRRSVSPGPFCFKTHSPPELSEHHRTLQPIPRTSLRPIFQPFVIFDTCPLPLSRLPPCSLLGVLARTDTCHLPPKALAGGGPAEGPFPVPEIGSLHLPPQSQIHSASGSH